MKFSNASLRSAANAGLGYAEALLRNGQWASGLKEVDRARAAGADLPASTALLEVIARVRSGALGVDAITPNLIYQADGRFDVRRLVVGPLLQDDMPAAAVVVLSSILEAEPEAAEEYRLRAGALARLARWDEAIADVDHCAELAPADEVTQILRLQYRLQAGRPEDAGDVARAMHFPLTNNRLANIRMISLLRVRAYPEAADLADEIDWQTVTDSGLAGNIVQAVFRAGRWEEAIEAGDQFLARSLDSSTLRSHLAQAWLRSPDAPQRFANAVAHLEAGLEQAPQDLRMRSMLGETLLRMGNSRAAIPHLRKSCELQPDMVQLQALLARALKQAGEYAEAAEFYEAVVGASPSARWQRYAAGALSQAGRREEAADLFDAWVAKRREALPESFSDGLEALWDKVDTVRIPQARLDWAWSLRAPDCDFDRAEWERRAKWGHLADHFLLDWLECRDAQVEEAMYHFAEELDWLEEFTAAARARAPGKGVVYASAHVGAMYFGPLSLELIGERSRWLASTPSVARTSYANTLISTSDQTDTQVARAFMQALKQDNIVVVVADGAINMAAPRVHFEGQEVTFSQFAARTAHRMGSSSAFVSPVWHADNHHLGFMLEHLPMPEDGESADDYAMRWQEAYFGHLRRFLAGRPENLRLSGGIWRHIR